VTIPVSWRSSRLLRGPVDRDVSKVLAARVDASPKNDHLYRGFGLALAGLGAFLLKLSLFDVLRDAEAHAATVSTSDKALFVAPPIILIGLFFLVIGAPRPVPTGLGRYFVDPSGARLSTPGKVLVVALTVIPGTILYFWLQHRLAALGYKDG
jgi:hypothetical protein